MKAGSATQSQWPHWSPSYAYILEAGCWYRWWWQHCLLWISSNFFSFCSIVFWLLVTWNLPVVVWMDIIIATMTFRFIMCLVRSFLFLLHCNLIVGYMESAGGGRWSPGPLTKSVSCKRLMGGRREEGTGLHFIFPFSRVFPLKNCTNLKLVYFYFLMGGRGKEGNRFTLHFSNFPPSSKIRFWRRKLNF